MTNSSKGYGKKERGIKRLGEQLTIEGIINKKFFEQKPQGRDVIRKKNIPEGSACAKTLL